MEGYRKIEGYGRYYINEEGEVYDTLLRRHIKPIFKKGYWQISLLGDDGVRKSVSRHRLVALTFLLNDDPERKRQVNHKKGIKGVDGSSNLEWCTGSYNRKHAIDNHLTPLTSVITVSDKHGNEEVYSTIKSVSNVYGIPYNELKGKLRRSEEISVGELTIKRPSISCGFGKTKVHWRNLKTGVCGVSESVVSAARQTGIPIRTVSSRLDGLPDRPYKDGYQFRRNVEFDGWESVGDFDSYYHSKSWLKGVSIKWLDNGSVKFFETQKEAAQFLDVSMAKLSTGLKEGGQLLVKHGKRFGVVKRLANQDPWIKVNDPFREYAKNNGLKPVVVRNVIDGTERKYISAVECAAELNIGTTTLNWRLKKPGNVYDNHTFKYLYH